MKEKITIIFAYRNRDINRIRISMESLARQARKNFLVIFVDYGSSTAYSKPVQKIIDSYPFAKYHYVAHPGLLWNKSKAFNFGIREAKTDFILTADVDLIFNPESIAVIENLVDASSFTLFNYGYLSQKITASLKDGTPFNELTPSHYGHINGVGLYPLHALKRIHGFDEFFHFYGSEDEDLFVRLENAGYNAKREPKNLFLHQWHPRYPRINENELTTQPRLTNILRVNQQHYLQTKKDKKIVPFKQKDWGKCFFKEDSIGLTDPTLQFRVKNVASSVIHFLNEHLPSCEGEILAINFVEDRKHLSLKNRLKRILGKGEQPVLTLKQVNDLVLEKIIFLYRHNNYSFQVSEDLKEIWFRIDLRSGPQL